MVKPKVSIVVPSYNHGRFLKQRMDSILRQTCQDFEVCVLDDASTDNTRQVLAEYAARPRVEMTLRQKNGGSVFRQWNAGVALARGEYVWIAESDDYADERFLEELTAVLDHNPGVGLVKCRSTIVDEEGRTTPDSTEYPVQRDWSRDFIISGPEDCRLQLAYGNSIVNASAVLFRRQLYLDAGWADESYRMCADWLQWSKMMLQADWDPKRDGSRLGTQFAYVAKPLNFYRRHTNTVRQKCLGNVIHDLEDLRVCAYLLSHLPVSTAVTHEVCDRIARRWVYHALSRSRLKKSLTYDLQVLHLLRQLDHWYAATIAKHLARRVLRKCALGSGSS
jgi:glycosyltransferase involved in cell wall biosynthesis